MDEEIRDKIKERVAYQFDHITNLSREAYVDSLAIISEQIESDFKALGYRKLPKD